MQEFNNENDATSKMKRCRFNFCGCHLEAATLKTSLLLFLSLEQPQTVLQSCEDKEPAIKVLVMQEFNNENDATTTTKKI